MRRRRGFVAPVAMVALSAGCASAGPPAGTSVPVAVSPTTQQIVFDLAVDGSHECQDVAGDVTVSAQTEVPPPVPLDGIELLRASVEMVDGILSGSFELAGAPDIAADPNYRVFFGLIDAPTSFELKVDQVESGLWGLSFARAGIGEGSQPVPTGSVSVDGAVVRFSVPTDVIPSILPNQPIVYGAAGDLVDADGELLDPLGNPLAGGATAVVALDDCLSFAG